jgi:3-oxoacid CoA-transferase subunit A
VTIAEAEEVVEGYLDPNEVVTPGVFVQRVVPVANKTKDIEQRTVRVRAEV